MKSSEIRKLYDELYEKVLRIFDKKIRQMIDFDDTFEYEISWIDRLDNGFEGSFYIKFKNQTIKSHEYRYEDLTLTFDEIDGEPNV